MTDSLQNQCDTAAAEAIRRTSDKTVGQSLEKPTLNSVASMPSLRQTPGKTTT